MKQKATSKIKIKKIPNELIIQLKRFKSSWCSVRGMVETKIPGFVEFELSFNIGKFMNKKNKIQMVDLCAVLVHCGDKIIRGHFISFIKVNNIWYF